MHFSGKYRQDFQAQQLGPRGQCNPDSIKVTPCDHPGRRSPGCRTAVCSGCCGCTRRECVLWPVCQRQQPIPSSCSILRSNRQATTPASPGTSKNSTAAATACHPSADALPRGCCTAVFCHTSTFAAASTSERGTSSICIGHACCRGSGHLYCSRARSCSATTAAVNPRVSSSSCSCC